MAAHAKALEPITWTLHNHTLEPLHVIVDGKRTDCLGGQSVKFSGVEVGISLTRYTDKGDGDWSNHTMGDEDLRFYASKEQFGELFYPIFKDPELCKTRGKNGGEAWDHYLFFYLDCGRKVINARYDGDTE